MSITSANAVLTMSITGLFEVPQQIQNFATDDIFDTETLEAAETMMGVDGILTGGYVNVPISQGYSLQADSASLSFFDTWYAAQRQIQDLYYANGVITLPSLQKKYTLTKGILKSYPIMSNAARVLNPRKFTIIWQSVVPAAIPAIS